MPFFVAREKEKDMTGNLLRRRDVEKKTGYSGSSIYRFMKHNKFPRPIKKEGSCRWLEDEVDKWINELVVTRNTHNGE